MTVSDPLRLIGVTLGHSFLVESLVREDEGSVVYRATHLRLNRTVAVRVLTAVARLPDAQRFPVTDRLMADQRELSDLRAIAPAAHQLREVGTVGTPQGLLPFLVLDWPHGLTLRQWMMPATGASFPESLDEVVAMLEPVAVALSLAHVRGVVHGDITPDRVLFCDESTEGVRRAVLLDFGVARVLRWVALGRDATVAEDVRALASVLSQMVARTCGADARSDEPRTPRARGVVVGDEVEEVFVHALERGTYTTVGAFWTALRATLGLCALRSLEATVPPESVSVASRSIRPTARSTPPSPPVRGTPVITYAIAVAVAGLVALTFMRVPSISPPSSAAVTAAACPDGMVAAGGSSARIGALGDADDPPHDVTLGAFCIDREAVSTRAYTACADRGACKPASKTNEWSGIGPEDHEALDVFCAASDFPASAARPVNCVSWDMASAFCAQRGARLPTEAEWELAARVTAAGVAEWVSDWRAPIAAAPAVSPVGPPSGDERVVRGAHAVGATPTRFGAAPSTMSHAIGFRCLTAR